MKRQSQGTGAAIQGNPISNPVSQAPKSVLGTLTLPSLPMGSCSQNLNIPSTLSKVRILGHLVKRIKSFRITLNKTGTVVRTTIWCHKEFMAVIPRT